MAGTQIVGNTNNTTVVEVEQNTNAARVVVRPDDYGSLGIFHQGANNGTTAMSAGLTAASPIFSFRYINSNVVLVKRVLLTFGSGGTGFAAGSAQFNMFAARGFSASDSGGTSVATAGSNNNNKLRTSMGSTVYTTSNYDARISATGTLTAGTRTLDAQALANISVPIGTGTSTTFIPANSTLFDQRVGEYPLVLAQNEGFVIQATVPATGTWFFSVQWTWLELSSY